MNLNLRIWILEKLRKALELEVQNTICHKYILLTPKATRVWKEQVPSITNNHASRQTKFGWKCFRLEKKIIHDTKAYFFTVLIKPVIHF